MPFGKHKGERLDALPDDYLEWLVGIGLREPLRSAVAHEYRVRCGSAAVLVGARAAAEAIVAAGYHALATRHHPDHGGATGTMQHVNVAADWLRRQLRGLSA
jgi:hypothetical protein